MEITKKLHIPDMKVTDTMCHFKLHGCSIFLTIHETSLLELSNYINIYNNYVVHFQDILFNICCKLHALYYFLYIIHEEEIITSVYFQQEAYKKNVICKERTVAHVANTVV